MFWRTCPAVTYGGKKNFFVTQECKAPDGWKNRRTTCWVVWDRMRKAWVAHTDYWVSLITFDTHYKAVDWVARNFSL